MPDILKKAHIPYIWRVCYPFFGEMMQSSVFYGKTGVHIWHIWRFFRAICQICPRERLHTLYTEKSLTMSKIAAHLNENIAKTPPRGKGWGYSSVQGAG